MNARMPCAELYVRLEDDEVLVLDCREHQDWLRYGQHVPGALWMTFEEILQDLSVLPDDELIVVCGCAPDGSDARRVCRLLHRLGFDVVCLDGGLQEWVTQGMPTDCHWSDALASEAC